MLFDFGVCLCQYISVVHGDWMFRMLKWIFVNWKHVHFGLKYRKDMCNKAISRESVCWGRDEVIGATPFYTTALQTLLRLTILFLVCLLDHLFASANRNSSTTESDWPVIRKLTILLGSHQITKMAGVPVHFQRDPYVVKLAGDNRSRDRFNFFSHAPVPVTLRLVSQQQRSTGAQRTDRLNDTLNGPFMSTT